MTDNFIFNALDNPASKAQLNAAAKYEFHVLRRNFMKILTKVKGRVDQKKQQNQTKQFAMEASKMVTESDLYKGVRERYWNMKDSAVSSGRDRA